uniref:Uncharacterized protein n=1 Tax=Octopus bimaculoides TaxID=37653 RepID=A0A0L8IDY0_OCTBM
MLSYSSFLSIPVFLSHFHVTFSLTLSIPLPPLSYLPYTSLRFPFFLSIILPLPSLILPYPHSFRLSIFPSLSHLHYPLSLYQSSLSPPHIQNILSLFLSILLLPLSFSFLSVRHYSSPSLTYIPLSS